VQIPDYIALPLIEAATLVDDEGLQEKWAALLANAAHPQFSPSMSPQFPKILANLLPREAKYLDLYFDYSVRQIFIKIRPLGAEVISSHSRVNEQRLSDLVGNSGFRWRSNGERAATLENLIGQGVLRRDQNIDPKSYGALAGKLFAEGRLKTPTILPTNVMVHMENFYEISVLGAEFVIACRPRETIG
jgi:hypothetical protein